MEVEPVEPVQMNIYESITYKKDLNWLYFDEVQKGSKDAATEQPTVLYIRFCSLSNNSKQQLGAPAQIWQQYSIHGRMVDL